MRKSQFSDSESLAMLKQNEQCVPLQDICWSKCSSSDLV